MNVKLRSAPADRSLGARPEGDDNLNCPICSADTVEVLDERLLVPIAQNLMYRDRASAVNCPQGSLRIVRCMTCGFAWNAAFDQALLKYDTDYENNQSLSPAFDRHLDEVAAAIRSQVEHLDRVTAVEVGCGQGYFLERLTQVFGDRLTEVVGFDPAYRKANEIPERARVEADLFDWETCRRVGIVPDLIVTRHVIEHVPDPVGFLSTIREVSRRGTTIAVETPNLQWILDGAVAHDFYYEHCSLFDAESLRIAMERCGFEVHEVSERLEGQYLLALGRAADHVTPSVRSVAPENANYPSRRDAYVRHWRERFTSERRGGETIALWGGASKGVTLALLLGADSSHLTAAIDINPARSGSFMPITGLPVILPEAARKMGISKAYVVNPVYRDEIAQYCRDQGWDLQLDVVN